MQGDSSDSTLVNLVLKHLATGRSSDVENRSNLAFAAAFGVRAVGVQETTPSAVQLLSRTGVDPRFETVLADPLHEVRCMHVLSAIR